ncbi:MAG: glycosyltransferase family 4 protein [Bryobacteraceae bacterium]
MKIVIDVRRVSDFGIGTYIRNLVHALAEVDHQTNRYVLVTPWEQAPDWSGLPPNFEIAAYERKDTDPLDHLTLPAYLRRFKADLAHFPFNRVPLLMTRPFVVTVHDLSSLLFEERKGLRQDLRRYRFRRGLTRAERVIAVSAATRRDVESLLGIAPERLRLVYSAPEPQFFRREITPGEGDAERQQILERYQIQYPFLLYTGSIRPQKNVPRLVEAFAVAREALSDHPEFRDLRLIIIGDEISRYPDVRRAVIQSRVEQEVRFLGFVPLETLRVFYQSATAFVFPSLYEGFGLPPLEAMAAGTPVITSSSSSLPEAVGDAAVLVNPENVFDIARGIKEVLFSPELRERLAAAGPKQASRFNWERTAREVLNIYREVAGD